MGSYAVIGATSWGVTLAWLLSNNGHDITLVTRSREEELAVARRRGLERLPEVRLGDQVTVLHASAAAGSPDGVVVAVPAQSLRATLEADYAWPTSPVLSAAKGIEHGTRAADERGARAARLARRVDRGTLRT